MIGWLVEIVVGTVQDYDLLGDPLKTEVNQKMGRKK